MGDGNPAFLPLPLPPVGGGQVDGHERRRRITPNPPIPRIDGPQGVDGGPVDSPVPEIGPGALLGRPLEELVALEEFVVLEEARDGGGRIVEVPGDDGPLGTHHHAGGLQPHLDAVHAVVALLGGVVHRVDVQRVVGGRLACNSCNRCTNWYRSRRSRRGGGTGRRSGRSRRREHPSSDCNATPRKPAWCRARFPSRCTSPRCDSRPTGHHARSCTPPCRRDNRCTPSGR